MTLVDLEPELLANPTAVLATAFRLSVTMEGW